MTDPLVAFYEQHPFPNDPRVVDHTVGYFKRLVKGENPRSVLIVGCGTGEDALAADRFFETMEITAIDPSRQSIRIAKIMFPTMDFRVASIETFKPEKEYDLIFCNGVLHHTKDPQKNLRRMLSWLSKDGVLLLGVYHHGRWEGRIDYSRTETQILDGTANPRERTYSWEGLTELVENAGGWILRTGHRLPVPRWRWAMLLYDLAFQQQRQQMMMIVIKRS